MNYGWTKIASLLNVSRSTLYRRLQDNNIDTNDFATLSDATLDSIIHSIKCDHPNDGEVLLQGHVRSVGLKVRRKDLRDSIHRVDNDQTQQRRAHTIQRRVYFIIHASIDGFSRTVTYIRCANNNRAQTVLEFVRGGITRFGLPVIMEERMWMCGDI